MLARTVDITVGVLAGNSLCESIEPLSHVLQDDNSARELPQTIAALPPSEFAVLVDGELLNRRRRNRWLLWLVSCAPFLPLEGTWFIASVACFSSILAKGCLGHLSS